MKYYAGVGSRQTPSAILKLMEEIALYLGKLEYCLRSGGASGADQAFELSARRGEFKCEIWRPQDATPESLAMAALFHPVWANLTPGVKNLLARNCMVVLGPYLNKPSGLVVCWTKDGANGDTIPTTIKTGGTGHAIRVAAKYRIKVYNLFHPEIRESIIKKMR